MSDPCYVCSKILESRPLDSASKRAHRIIEASLAARPKPDLDLAQRRMREEKKS